MSYLKIPNYFCQIWVSFRLRRVCILWAPSSYRYHK